jgi:hypothetical protein
MTSQHPASDGPAAATCRRPGCGQPLPAGGRGRTRQFCSDDCARRYHNDARLPAPGSWPGNAGEDPLASLDTLTRQAAVLIKAAREQAATLDPARVRVQVAEAEAARRRAEAAAVTADARAAEAEAETQALTEALTAARDAADAAEAAARQAGAAAQATQDELARLRRDTTIQITAIQAQASQDITAARQDADRCARERDDAAAAARETTRNAETEITRARQAEADARAETSRVRDDAARERDAFHAHHQAQLDTGRALTDAERARAERAEAQLDTERADRRHLTSQLTPPATHTGNGQATTGKRTRPATPQP